MQPTDASGYSIWGGIWNAKGPVLAVTSRGLVNLCAPVRAP